LPRSVEIITQRSVIGSLRSSGIVGAFNPDLHCSGKRRYCPISGIAKANLRFFKGISKRNFQKKGGTQPPWLSHVDPMPTNSSPINEPGTQRVSDAARKFLALPTYSLLG
jgi:hypothetical protein